jgi:hypothetical protein
MNKTPQQVTNQITALNDLAIEIPDRSEQVSAAVFALRRGLTEAEALAHNANNDSHAAAAATAASWLYDTNPDREDVVAWFRKLN